jgi:hypothetical protein
MKNSFTKIIYTHAPFTVRLCLLVCLLAYAGKTWATIRYVKETGTGNGDSWETASNDFQTIINASASGDTVWVAKGTYQPASYESFSMKEGVKIYGGFAGTEETLPQRDLTTIANKSILQGNGSAVMVNDDYDITNAAVLDGFTITGGIDSGIKNQYASPMLVNLIINDNKSEYDYGGGLFNVYSSPLVINCIISNNVATSGAGGMYNSASAPVLINCTVSNNEGLNNGSVIVNKNNSGTLLRNSIVHGNTGGIENDTYSVTIIRYSLVQGITDLDPGDHNISGDVDPLFVDAAAGNYQLAVCSPAVNKGSNDYYDATQTINISTVTTDLAGNTRFYDNGVVDLGAYEYQGNTTTPVAGVVYVKEGGTGLGASWECAKGDLQSAIDVAASGQEVWVAGGTYQPGIDQSFFMKDGVKIYGGLAGTETDLASRNLAGTKNKSILLGNGGPVLFIANSGETTALDGFTITGGASGGLVNNQSSPMLVNLIITGNSGVEILGGGITNMGSSPTLINSLIYDNEAVNGGGIANYGSQPVIINCTIASNDVSGVGGGIYNNQNSSPKLYNSIVYENSSGIQNESGSTMDIKYSLVQSETNLDPDDHNLPGNSNPLFVNAGNGDFRLKSCSPVIDLGNDYYAAGQIPDLSFVTTDLESNLRNHGTTCDLGAYESTGTPSIPSLAVSKSEFTGEISGDSTLTASSVSCAVLANLSPNGADPVSGELTAKVWVEDAQPLNFLKRHYEITPATNAETATARVTLYFTQQEFTDFNAINSLKLPVDAEDTENYKARLRIEKRAGTSSDSTGLPSTYTGSVATINPLDPAVNWSILWNSEASRWEVSFNVTGFSGFFAKTTEAALPLNLVSFTASKEMGSNLLQWKTTSEVNTLNFEVQSSRDAKTFNKIGTVNANGSGNHQYNYKDVTTYYGNAYYRLKMNDHDGTFAYSKMVALANEGNRAVVYPNPASTSITITVNPPLFQSTATLYDVTGRQLQSIRITTNQQEVNIKSLTSGIYILKFADGTAERFVKE